MTTMGYNKNKDHKHKSREKEGEVFCNHEFAMTYNSVENNS